MLHLFSGSYIKLFLKFRVRITFCKRGLTWREAGLLADESYSYLVYILSEKL